MLIDARHIFGCTHTYVSVNEAGVLLFACGSCGYRTELLPLSRRPGAQPPLPSRARAKASPPRKRARTSTLSKKVGS